MKDQLTPEKTKTGLTPEQNALVGKVTLLAVVGLVNGGIGAIFSPYVYYLLKACKVGTVTAVSVWFTLGLLTFGIRSAHFDAIAKEEARLEAVETSERVAAEVRSQEKKAQYEQEALEQEVADKEALEQEAVKKEAADKAERARVAAIKAESDAKRAKATKKAQKAIAAAPASSSCDPSYPTICISPNSADLNCSDIPNRRFKVVGGDAHGFDRDDDGIGCES